MENADSCWAAASSLVSRTYSQQGCQALARRRRQVTTLLSQRRLPEQGWDDTTIEMLLQVRGCVRSLVQAPWERYKHVGWRAGAEVRRAPPMGEDGERGHVHTHRAPLFTACALGTVAHHMPKSNFT